MRADHLQLVSPFSALQKHLVSVGITLLFQYESFNLHYSPSFSDLAQSLLSRAQVTHRGNHHQDGMPSTPYPQPPPPLGCFIYSNDCSNRLVGSNTHV